MAEYVPARKTAKAWQHFCFSENEENTVVCKLCLKTVKYNGGTSNMNSHLKRHHKNQLVTPKTEQPEPMAQMPDEASSSSSIDNQKPATESVKPSDLASRQKITIKKSHQITTRIANHLIQNMRPLSEVDNKAFKEMIRECEPRYKIPSRTTFKENIIPRLYEQVSVNVRKNISGKSVAFTTDSWTSRATKSYVTITAHYLTENFDMVSMILQTRELEHSHTGENIGAVLRDTAKEWGCLVQGLTTDNASNKRIAAKAAGISVHCFARTLNLASNKAVEVKSVHQLLGKVRTLVTFFHKSTTAADILREKQVLFNVPEHELVSDVKSRWNSSYLMVERFLQQQEPLTAAMMEDKVKKMHGKKSKTYTDILSTVEVKKLEIFKQIMTPMYDVTSDMSEDQSFTVGLILPLLNKLKLHFSVSDEDTDFAKAIKKAVLDILETRYKNEELIAFLEEAQALDPRFKHETSDGTWDRLELKMVALSVTKKHSDKEAPPKSAFVVDDTDLPSTSSLGASADSPPKKKRAFSYLFHDKEEIVEENAPLSLKQMAAKELELYKAIPKLQSSQNPLMFWRTNSEQMPMLSKVVRATLCVQASSVPIERVFSIAGDIVTPTRACLDCDTLDMLIFLEKNMSSHDLQNAMETL